MPYHICLWRCIYVNTCSLIPSATGTTQFIVYCSVNVLFYSIQKSNSTTLIYLHEPINGSYITPWLIFTIPYQNLEIKKCQYRSFEGLSTIYILDTTWVYIHLFICKTTQMVLHDTGHKWYLQNAWKKMHGRIIQNCLILHSFVKCQSLIPFIKL